MRPCFEELKLLCLVIPLCKVAVFLTLVEPPRVAVMILNYNGLRWLPNCLSSVARTDYRNLDVYLVDNGSVDGSVEYVQKNFPWVKIICHERNLGYAEGYNKALEKIDADHIVLLNSDVKVLDPSWVEGCCANRFRDRLMEICRQLGREICWGPARTSVFSGWSVETVF